METENTQLTVSQLHFLLNVNKLHRDTNSSFTTIYYRIVTDVTRRGEYRLWEGIQLNHVGREYKNWKKLIKAK